MAERPLIGRGLFLTNERAANYQRVRTNQAMDTLTEYTCLSISPAFPRVGGKPDHISSQGKEAVFVTHDTLPQVIKAFALYYKNKKYIYKNHSIFTFINNQLRSGEINKCHCLKGGQIKPPSPL